MHEPAPARRRGWVLPVAGGLAAGVVAGLFGVGGGVLLVPLLVLVIGRSQHEAHATSLVGVTLATAAGVARFAVDGAVWLPGAAALAVGAITGARAGAALLPRLSEGWLRRLFVLLVVVVAGRFLVGGGPGGSSAGLPTIDAGVLAIHVLGGLAAGVTSSVLGVGGGIVIVPLLTLGLGYGQHVAEGTSLAVIVPTALTGALAHARHGLTDWRLGSWLGMTTVLGSLAGATLALSLSPVTLGRLFGGLLLAVGALMVWRARPGGGGGRAAADGGHAPADRGR